MCGCTIGHRDDPTHLLTLLLQKARSIFGSGNLFRPDTRWLILHGERGCTWDLFIWCMFGRVISDMDGLCISFA